MLPIISLLLCSLSVNSNYHFEEQIKETKTIEVDNVLGIGEDSFAYQINQECYLEVSENAYYLQTGSLVDTCINQNNIYVLITKDDQSTIYKFNQMNQTMVLYELKHVSLNTIEPYNQYILVGGCKNNDGVLYKLDYDLKTEEEYRYGGDGYEAITSLKADAEVIYIGLEKSGISNNSGFINIGNSQQIKSLILKLDQNFKIVDTFYFNHDQDQELISKIFLTKEKLEVILKVAETYVYYVFNQNLELLVSLPLAISNAYQELFFLPNHKTTNQCLFLESYQDLLSLNLNQDLNAIYHFKASGVIKAVSVNQGVLYLYLVQDQTLQIVSLTEYEVIKNQPIILNHSHPTYVFNNYLIVESFFEELTFNEKKINPYFSNTINGIYTIIYEAIRQNQDIIHVNGSLIVEAYTNFIDQGVYEKGKRLEFFGNAVMNNKTIYNGTTLDEVGTYEIEITDANQKVTKYQLYIVDNYYKATDDFTLEYEIKTHNAATISYNFSEEIEIIDVIINQQSYDKYEVCDQILTIKFDQNSQSYKLEKIIYLDNGTQKVLNLNEVIDVCYFKSAPIIDIDKVITNDNLAINLNISDDEQTFMYLKVVTKTLGKIVSEQIVTDYLCDELVNQSQNHLLIYYVYHLGGGEVVESLIYEYLASEDIAYEIKVSDEDNKVTNAVIKVKLPKDLNTIKVMKVGNVDILGLLDNELDNPFFKIIVISSIILLILDAILMIIPFIWKRKKRQTIDH